MDVWHASFYNFINLVVDNRIIVGVTADWINRDYNVMSSNTAIIRLSAGQFVWLENYKPDGEIHSTVNNRFVSFPVCCFINT